jgi:hypothetical protein
MMLTMWRIQDIRLLYQTKNYLNGGTDALKRMLMAAMAKRIINMRKNGNGNGGKV